MKSIRIFYLKILRFCCKFFYLNRSVFVMFPGNFIDISLCKEIPSDISRRHECNLGGILRIQMVF